MKKRLRIEYFLVAAVMLLLFVGSIAATNFFFQKEMVAQQKTYLRRKNTLLTDQLPPSVFEKGQLTNQQQLLVTHALDDAEERVTLLQKNGTVFFDSSQNEPLESHKKRPEIAAVLSGATYGSALRKSKTLNKELLYVATPVLKSGEIVGIIRISEQTALFSKNIQSFRRYIIFTFGILFLLITLFIFLLLRQKNQPLVTVLPILKRMLKHPDENRSIIQQSSEWNELYETINLLSQQVSQTYKAYTSADEQFHELLDELMIGVFIIDTQGRLRLLNPKMQEMLGLSAKNMQSNYLEVIQDADLIHLIHQVVAEKNSLHQEITVTQGPTPLRLDLSLRYLDDQSANDYQVLGIAYDLTRVRQLEKMQKDFVSNVSHELKTPVTSLLGFTETLIDGAKEDPKVLDQFLHIMQKDAQRLQQLIQEILELSRGSATIPYAEQEITLEKFITEILGSYQQQLAAKQLKTVVHGLPESQFFTKYELFYPIVKNLIENAIQYSQKNGQITISYAIENQQLRLSVQDTGIGISQKDQERIFERFYRVDKARSRHSGGTGLGLAIVQNYTELLGGKIAIDSHLGLGTTFTITLPLTKKEA
ncbi:two-component system histidine kinase PnpS [Enterococcus faecalis]|uniref:two-component system histidine kinase PnpS n=1 Tax=Enterococcus faecalis TaxID=1351 RepID=UPI003B7E8B08